MRLFIAEKPSLARAIADVLPKPHRKGDGFIECGNGQVVTWCIGHLLEQAQPDVYDSRYARWNLQDLPIVPEKWQLQPRPSVTKQLNVIKRFLHEASEVIHAGDPDREGQLLVDEVLDSVDPSTRNFLLKSSLLRSMNDSLIARVTGEENGQMRLEEIERQGLFVQRMDNSGEWFNYHPLFCSFLRQRCQWELAAELPDIHRAAAESWMAQGFPSEAIHHALAAGDPTMLRDILLNHAWGLFHHSELALLEESLSALPWESLLENPRLVLLQAWLMQSQHRYSEVNTLLARAEQEMTFEMDSSLHGDFNALRAQVAINDGDQDEAERLSTVALEELPLANFYSRIVATSVHGEVLHCKGLLSQSIAVMQDRKSVV
mgnify:CR=1 FL=1